MYLKEISWEGSEQGAVGSSCDHVNEPFGSMKLLEFPDGLSKY
jgi:hypothetical protein